MIGEVRAHLADVLNPVGIPVHAYPPGAVAPPAIVIIPADPYCEGLVLQDAHRIGLEARLFATNPQALDDLIDLVVATLIAAGLPPQPINRPDSDADTGTLYASVLVPIIWTT